ncbi:MAG: hypothetical protein HPY72_08695 [Anaerolineae bacterium]|nr:hypothetical protein [Anaerolineae bacterium]
MTQLTDWLKILVSERRNTIFAALAAFAASLLLYIAKFQRNFFSKTYLAVTILVFLAAFVLFAVINHSLIAGFMRRSSPANRRLLILSSILLSLLLLLNFNPVPLYLLDGAGTLTVEPLAESAAASAPVALLYARNQLGNIPYADLQISGEWRGESDRLVLLDGAALAWQGVTAGQLEIGFEPAAQPLKLRITVNGEEREFDLQGKADGDIAVFRYESQPSLISKLPFILSVFLLSLYLLIALLSFLSSCSIQKRFVSIPKGRVIWLGVPLLASAILTLLIFWPGMLTNDSMNQWAEIVSGDYSDLNPLLHTLLLSGLVHLVHSPAIVALFQIVMLCLVLVYGLAFLNRQGVSLTTLIGLAFLFAFWPFNPLMVNTLWKDVLYSIALLALFIFILEIVFSDGKWLENKLHFLLLGLSAFSVMAFRLNGLPVAMISCGVLPLFYKKYRKGLWITLASLLLLWSLVKGPLQSRFARSEVSTSALNLTLLHHIAAHYDEGTVMTQPQLDYLDELLPLSEWKYDCCYMGNIYTHPEFDQISFMCNFSQNFQIASSLFVKDPMIDVRDQLCASEMDWRFIDNRCTFKSLHPFDVDSTSIKSWIPDNEFGLEENSLLPQGIPFYFTFLNKIGAFSGTSTALLRPAFYVYLTVIVLIAAAIRLNNKKLLLAALPVLLQTGILALINFAPAFRYQYGVCLIGLFCIGLLFLPVENRKDG